MEEESPYKPDSVKDNHPSGVVITNYLGATYPGTQRAASSFTNQLALILVLLRVGFT